MKSSWKLATATTALLLGAVLGQSTLARAYCTGDCDGDGVVLATEAAICQNIILGQASLGDCAACDCGGNGTVNSGELAQANRNVIDACNPAQCPPPTLTATPLQSPIATATAAPSETVAPTATPPNTPVPTASVTPPNTPEASPTATVPAACMGDCDGSGSVSVAELVRGVNIALDQRPLIQCASLDRSGSGRVEISELVAAVANALNGCG